MPTHGLPSDYDPGWEVTVADRKRAASIFDALKSAYGTPGTVLLYSNPLELALATILSAQCTDERVNLVTRSLFTKYRSPEDYLRVPAEELEADIHSTGFFRNKTRSIRGLCRKILDNHGGAVPDTMEELVQLPGIGRKTANIILSNAFGKVEGIAVDTHVGRLASRLGFSSHSDPIKIEKDLMSLFPRNRWMEVTYLLIEHGRAVCKARKPRCAECFLSALCPSAHSIS